MKGVKSIGKRTQKNFDEDDSDNEQISSFRFDNSKENINPGGNQRSVQGQKKGSVRNKK